MAGAAWAVRRWRPSRIEIRGRSMLPTLAPGDWALATAPRQLRRGDIVVVEHPERPGHELVKRLSGIPGDSVGGGELGAGEWWVEGDAPDASTDSRSFGPVSPAHLLARVRLVYWPPDHRRLLQRGARGIACRTG